MPSATMEGHTFTCLQTAAWPAAASPAHPVWEYAVAVVFAVAVVVVVVVVLMALPQQPDRIHHRNGFPPEAAHHILNKTWPYLSLLVPIAISVYPMKPGPAG